MENKTQSKTKQECVEKKDNPQETLKKDKIMSIRPIVTLRLNDAELRDLPCGLCGRETEQSTLFDFLSENNEPICRDCAKLYAPVLFEFFGNFYQGKTSQDVRLQDEIFKAFLSFTELESVINSMSNKDYGLLNFRIYELIQNNRYNDGLPF